VATYTPLCRIGVESWGIGLANVRGRFGNRDGDVGDDKTVPALVCIDRGLETAEKDGAYAVCFIVERIGAAWGAAWTNEAVVQVRRGNKKRGNSATGLGVVMGGICSNKDLVCGGSMWTDIQRRRAKRATAEKIKDSTQTQQAVKNSELVGLQPIISHAFPRSLAFFPRFSPCTDIGCWNRIS